MPKSKTTPTKSEILESAANGALLDAIFIEYGRTWWSENDPAISLLSSLHNDGEIDLLKIITPESLAPYKDRIFFQGQRIYQLVISRLNTSTERLLYVVDALLNAAGQDGAAGLIVEEFAKWCSHDPSRPAELLALVDASVTHADWYLSIALTAGASVDRAYYIDRAYSFMADGSQTERLAAINALGQITIAIPSELDRLFAAFERVLKPDPGDVTRSKILTSLTRLHKHVPPTHVAAFEAIALTAVLPGGDYTLFEAARTLATSLVDLSEAVTESFLEKLAGVDTEKRGTVGVVDLALVKQLETGRAARVRTFLERASTIKEHGFTLKNLEMLTHKLREIGGEVLEDWVVAWLRTGDLYLCDQMDGTLFVTDEGPNDLTIDFDRFGLRRGEFGYLARKAIATFFTRPVLATSILLSLLRTAPNECATTIEALLFDPILINYSGLTSTYLRQVADDQSDRSGPAAARALDKLEAYIDGLKSVGNVSELHPSERERQLEWQRQTDRFNEALEIAREKSIFRQILTESLMLYGSRAVHWVSGPEEKPRRIESKLSSIGTSFEMPRVDVVDPLGLQLMLLAFRLEKLPE